MTKTLTAEPTPSPIPVIDVCCGSRMFWFDKNNAHAIFCDKRRDTFELNDKSVKTGKRTLVIDPDIVSDFTNLPFEDEQFAMVVFDPPHLKTAGKKSWMAKKYGKLEGDWKDELRGGFVECFRILKTEGTLIFKWNETQIPVSEIIPLSPVAPLIGQRCGKTAKTHWIVFMKPSPETETENQ